MTTLRIGRPPRASRRVRAARALNYCGRLALGWGITCWACYWLVGGSGSLFLVGLVLASMICAPRRYKRPARPALGGLRNAGHQLRRVWRLRRPMPGVIPPSPVGG